MIALKKINKNKKFLSGLCALIVAVALVSVGVTMAAFSAMTRETNVVTIGSIKIKLIDEYPDEGVDGVTPNQEVDKVVSVQNTGNQPCYVRLFIKKQWFNAYGVATTEISTDLIQPQYKSGWVKGQCPSGSEYSGFECYYYQYELGQGATADSLFDKFKLGANFDVDRYGNYEGHIIVKAEAVQSEYIGSELVKDSTGNIIGWPTSLVFN